MANSNDDSHTLRERLDALPPELWEMIYDWTFTAGAKIRMYSWEPESQYFRRVTCAELHELAQGYSNDMVTVNEIPHLLHVDRASRKKFAESFYGNPNSRFVVSPSWIAQFPTHKKLVKNLHLDVGRWASGFYDRQWWRFIAQHVARYAQNISFISYKGIEALLEKSAGVTGEACD